ncbi:MAG: CIA30 family protein [Hyphomicrobiaceae bacterium]
MRSLISLALSVLLTVAWGPTVSSQPTTIEDFTMQPQARWRFFTDGVMGGVSSGQLVFMQDGDRPFARMTGRVSTANKGGFIQMRLDLTSLPPKGATGVRFVVRGNDQHYFAHLRTTGTILPWQYYQSGFRAPRGWTEVRLPFTAFAASGALLRTNIEPQSLTSVAVVAFGRDHEAAIDVREVGYY